MNELVVAPDGRYLSGDIPLGYALWGDRLVEVPAELDACVTAIRGVKAGQAFEEIAATMLRVHGIEVTRARFDALIQSVYRRFGPI